MKIWWLLIFQNPKKISKTYVEKVRMLEPEMMHLLLIGFFVDFFYISLMIYGVIFSEIFNNEKSF